MPFARKERERMKKLKAERACLVDEKAKKENFEKWFYSQPLRIQAQVAKQILSKRATVV